MLRRTLFVVTLVVWAALLGRLALPAPIDTGAMPPMVAPVDSASSGTVAGIYREGVRIGESTTSIRPVEGGYVLEQTTVLALRVLGQEARVESSLTADLGPDRSVRSIAVDLRSGGTRFDARGEVRGREFRYRVDSGGTAREGSIELEKPLYVAGGARAFVADRLAPGRRFEFSVLDPLVWNTGVLFVQVEGEETVSGVAAWRLEETHRGIRTAVWMDDSARVIAERGPMGLEILLDSGPPDSRRNRAIAPLDIEAVTAIEVDGVQSPRTREELRLRISGVPAATIPQGGSQHLEAGDVLVLTRVAPEGVGTYRLPHPGDEMAAYLARAELLPVGHPRLELLVREILGAERDALTAARRLAQWVFEYLEKTPSIGIPEAIAVLDAGRGDCNEHAALFTALARTAGLPARLVAGLVFVEGRFVYHAWSEVRGAGGWLPVDPALGQFPADATHIALVHGDLEAQAGLMAIVGQLRLEVVE